MDNPTASNRPIQEQTPPLTADAIVKLMASLKTFVIINPGDIDSVMKNDWPEDVFFVPDVSCKKGNVIVVNKDSDLQMSLYDAYVKNPEKFRSGSKEVRKDDY